MTFRVAGLLLLSSIAFAQTPVPAKEYIRVGGRIVAIESPAQTGTALVPASLTFSATPSGADPSAQQVNVTSAGNWTATVNPITGGNWLSLAPASGSSPGTFTVSATAVGLGIGTYTASVTVSSTVGAPRILPVTLNVGSFFVSPTIVHYNGGGGSFQALNVVAASNVSWTTTSGSSWIHVLSGSSGSISYSVDANVSGSKRQGTLTVQPSTGSPIPVTVTEEAIVAGSTPVPSLQSSTPMNNQGRLSASARTESLGSSVKQRLVIRFDDANGPGAMGYSYVLINNSPQFINVCQLSYDTASRVFQVNGVTATPGQGPPVSAVHCIVDVANSNVILDDAGFTMDVVVTLQPSALGMQTIYAFGYDNANGLSPTYSLENWPAFPLNSSNPPTLTLPSPGAGRRQKLHVTLSDENGFQFITAFGGDIRQQTGAPSGCNFFVGLRDGGTIALQTFTSGAGAVPTGSGTFGTGGLIGAPGTCWVDLAASSLYTMPANQDPNAGLAKNIYLDLVVVADPGMPGPLQITMGAYDQLGQTGTLPPTTWTVDTVDMTTTTTAVTVTSSTSATVPLTLSPPTSGFNGPVALSASGLPSGMSVSFSPASPVTVVSPTNRSVTATISVSSGAVTGIYNVTLSAAASGIAVSQAIQVSVNPPPPINLSPASLSFIGTIGGANPATQQVTVTTPGSSLAWTASSSSSWLSVSPASGSATPATLTISAAIGSLTAGTYSGAITVTVPGAANSPQTLPVSFVIQPSLTVSPGGPLAFSVITGQNPASQALTITGPSSWTATTATTTGGSWLSISPASGGSPTTLTVSPATSSLSAGNYSGSVTVTAGSASQTVNVNLTVATFLVTPTTLQFYGAGGSYASLAVAKAASVTHWTVASNSSWLHSNGSDFAPIPFSVDANAGSARSGILTVTANDGTVVQVTINQAAMASSSQPTISILNPLTSGSLSSSVQQTLTIRFDHPNGPAAITNGYVIIDNTLSWSNLCQIGFNIPYRQFYVSDGLNSGEYTLGQAQSPATGVHCQVDVANSAIVYSGTGFTLNVVVTLRPSALGTQTVYSFVQDSGGTWSPTYSLATWPVYALNSTNAPSITMVQAPTPARRQTLHLKFSDDNGFLFETAWVGDIRNTTTTTGCNFFISTQSQGIAMQWFRNGSNYSGGSGTLGVAGVLSAPGNCAIDLGASSIHTSPANQDPNAGLVMDLYLDLVFIVDPGLAGPLRITFSSGDKLQQTGNMTPQTWTVATVDLIAASTAVTATVASPATAALTLTPPTSGFTGTVPLTVTGAPTGMTVSFSPASPVSVASPNNTSVSATISVTSAVASGTYNVTITATANSVAVAQTIQVTVP